MRELNNVGNPYEARKVTANHIGSALVALPFNIISRLRTGDPCCLSSSPSSPPSQSLWFNDSHGKMRCLNRWSDLKQLNL